MSPLGQNRWFEERYLNDRYPIRKQTMVNANMNGRSWPNPAIGARAMGRCYWLAGAVSHDTR
jgi:hypothetical protein